MDEQTVEWIDGWKDGTIMDMDECIEQGQCVGCIDRRIGILESAGRRDEWMGRLWIDCFIAHWMKRGMDGWINDWIMNSLFRGINKELDKYSGEWIMDRVING